MISAPPKHEVWNSFTLPSLRLVAGSIRTVALSFLMDSLGIGGSRWIRQFIYGFDLVGSFSQTSVFPGDFKASPPHFPDIFGCDRAPRLCSRARASPFPHSRHLRGEAMAHVACGWPADPLPFDAGGNLLWSDFEAVNVVFDFRRFADAKSGRSAISNTA